MALQLFVGDVSWFIGLGLGGDGSRESNALAVFALRFIAPVNLLLLELFGCCWVLTFVAPINILLLLTAGKFAVKAPLLALLLYDWLMLFMLKELALGIRPLLKLLLYVAAELLGVVEPCWEGEGRAEACWGGGGRAEEARVAVRSRGLDDEDFGDEALRTHQSMVINRKYYIHITDQNKGTHKSYFAFTF